MPAIKLTAPKIPISTRKPDFADGKPYEAFAVLSLWMLADAIEWLQHKKADGLDEPLAAVLKELGNNDRYVPINVSLAGEYALQAMDAVCHAEHLLEIERLEQAHDSMIEMMSKQIEMASKQMHNDYLCRVAQQEKEERTRRSMKAEALNIARHRKTREAKERVFKEWEKDPSKFPSAEKAGRHLCDWLAREGMEYEPRTVIAWIRDHAKRIGVRFR